MIAISDNSIITESNIDINDISSHIHGSGLKYNDVMVILVHLFNLPVHCAITKTRHRNFVRAMIHLVVYVYYLNTYHKTIIDDMTSAKVGYIHEFETQKPHKNDSKYQEVFEKIYKELKETTNIKSHHPTNDDFEKWAGNIYNLVCVVLRNLYRDHGVVSDEETTTAKGICPNWNKFLLSMGIDLKELATHKK